MKQESWAQSLITIDDHGVVLKAIKLSYNCGVKQSML